MLARGGHEADAPLAVEEAGVVGEVRVGGAVGVQEGVDARGLGRGADLEATEGIGRTAQPAVGDELQALDAGAQAPLEPPLETAGKEFLHRAEHALGGVELAGVEARPARAGAAHDLEARAGTRVARLELAAAAVERLRALEARSGAGIGRDDRHRELEQLLRGEPVRQRGVGLARAQARVERRDALGALERTHQRDEARVQRLIGEVELDRAREQLERTIVAPLPLVEVCELHRRPRILRGGIDRAQEQRLGLGEELRSRLTGLATRDVRVEARLARDAQLRRSRLRLRSEPAAREIEREVTLEHAARRPARAEQGLRSSAELQRALPGCERVLEEVRVPAHGGSLEQSLGAQLPHRERLG